MHEVVWEGVPPYIRYIGMCHPKEYMAMILSSGVNLGNNFAFFVSPSVV